MKYLGKIKSRYNDDVIPWPDDIWSNRNYRFRLDGGTWYGPIKSYNDLCIASVIELAILSEV